MTEKLYRKFLSPRHRFEFDELPTVKASCHGGSSSTSTPSEYGPMLDCTYEMTNYVSSANGGTFKDSMEQVLRDEGWRLLPKHKKMILDRLGKDYEDYADPLDR